MGDIVDFLQKLAAAQQTAAQDMHGKVQPSEFLNPMPGTPGMAAPNVVPFPRQAPIAPQPTSSLVPRAERGMRVPQIRDQNHLNQLLNKAEGDADLRAISQQMQKQGLDSSGLGID